MNIIVTILRTRHIDLSRLQDFRSNEFRCDVTLRSRDGRLHHGHVLVLSLGSIFEMYLKRVEVPQLLSWSWQEFIVWLWWLYLSSSRFSRHDLNSFLFRCQCQQLIMPQDLVSRCWILGLGPLDLKGFD